MRTLGIDFGTRRVGLALSDAGGGWATPYEVLNVTSPEQATAGVLQIICKEGVERVVVGVPLNMDGSVGGAAIRIVEWALALGGKAGKPVVLVDERLSSFDAEQQLVIRKQAGEKLTRARKKKQLDAVAAAGFLQGFLDGKLPPLRVKQ